MYAISFDMEVAKLENLWEIQALNGFNVVYILQQKKRII